MYVLLASVFTIGKRALMHTAPFFLTAVRLVPAGLIFMSLSFVLHRKNITFRAKAVPLFAGVAFFYFLMDAFRFVGLTQIPASHAALLSALTPFVTALLSNLVFKESFTLKKLGALCLGFVGVLPLIIQNILATRVSNNGASSMQLAGGYAAMFVCVLSVVIGTFFFKRLVTQEKYPVIWCLGTALFFGGVASGLVSLFFESWNPFPVTNVSVVAPLILFLFITHNLISQPLYGYLVKKYPVTLVSFATLVTPLTTAVLGFFLYDQPIGYTFLFSVITLAVAFALFYHEEKREGLIH